MKPAPEFYSSPLSQFCAEMLPGDFHYLDGDEVVLRYSAQPIAYKRATRILRIFESKYPGEELRRSQRDVFPILATIIQLAIDQGEVATGSGVFIVEGDPPYIKGAVIRRVLPASISRKVGVQTSEPIQLDQSDLGRFVGCAR